MLRRSLCSFFVLLAAAPLAAQLRLVPTVGAPAARSGFSLVPWNATSMLLFGGDAANPAATEWLWDGIAWTSLVTPVPRRNEAALAVREPNGGLVLFGGVDGSGAPLFDTWRYDNGVWTQLATATSPPAMTRMSMAWDPATSSMVLVGRTALGVWQTWRLQDANWSQVVTAVLSVNASPTVFLDSVRNDIGLLSPEPTGFAVFRLQNGLWTLVSNQPSALAPGVAAFDRDRGRAVWVAEPVAGATMREWDGLSLGPPTPTGIAGTFMLEQMAIGYLAARQETTLVLGNTALRVFRWTPEPVPLATAYGAPCQDPTFRLGLAAGDSPTPGSSHRLRAQGQNGSFLTLALVGFSHTVDGGQPLPRTIPIGALACQQRAQAAILAFLGIGLPASLQIVVPNSASLLGTRYDAQFLQFDATGVLDASNGLEIQIGLPLSEFPLVETFNTAGNRDPQVSGDIWANGIAQAGALGGDGRHGSFDATFGQFVNGVYEWNTDLQLIPASATLSGTPLTVTDGRFYFTDFVLPAGVAVRFVGSVAPQIHVRGLADIRGTIDVSGAEMPFWVPGAGSPGAGQHVSTFDSRGVNLFVNGQPGGAPGCGGGRGGDGADECQSLGPAPAYDGRAGQDVRLQAGHAYGSAAVGTGGRGGLLNPASGLTVNTPLVGTLYRPHFSQGGSGGGFSGPGGQSTGTPLVGVVFSAFANPGLAFPLMPFPPVAPPPNYTSLNHFLVGGSGGGGGGSAPFGTYGFSSIATVPPNVYQAGHGGTGGGGAVALRAGGDLTVRSTATLRSKGGAGVLITGDSPASPTPDINHGISSPGGGGSGGSFLLQSNTNVTVDGTIDTSGGLGSRTGSIVYTPVNQVTQAGTGAPGFYRLEGSGAITFTGTGTPAFVAADHSGPLTDRDDHTGSRSLWLQPATTDLPVYLRYELVVDVGGATVLFSDDPSVSLLRADDPAGPALLRVQGARLDPLTGNVLP
ncbi:MAG TPA: kelch repeat-containing protein, partial [Planctomycetota bacterium]|nr:kelch repeat-containing protein [Planctomycetota bacterium]